MGTTFEREPAEILLSMKVNNSLDNPMESPLIARGFKRHVEDDGPFTSELTPNTINTPLQFRENRQVKAKKYLESTWESDQPPVQGEVEVLATQEMAAVLAMSQASRQSAKTKEQQAQLPKPLKESLKHLKNLLKLPKARRWVYCEYFYSDIDRELLLAENEFRQCLRESFPNLKTHLLRRAEWRQVRRLIGRPRRCSQAFFDSERAALEARRHRIRQVHRGETLTMDPDEIDIPLRIPKQLTVGAKVHARVRTPKDGIYSGTVDAVMDSRYRIIFDKDVVMPLIVSDFEIMSDGHEDLVSVAFLLENNKVAQQTALRGTYPSAPGKFMSTTDMSPAKGVAVTGNDPILTSVNCPPPVSVASTTNGMVPARSNMSLTTAGTAPATTKITREDRCGNYPLRLVVMLVKLAKVLDIKKILIAQVQEMNREAERMHLYTEGYVKKFQDKYAKTVVNLERVNHQLEGFLVGVSEYVGTLLPQLTEVTVTSRPEALHRFCQTHAAQIVKTSNQVSRSPVRSRSTLHLVTSLTSLLLQVRALGQQQCNAFELHTLQQTIEEIKNSLDSGNRGDFEDNVEVHIKQIEFTMQGGDTASLSSNLMDFM